MSLGIATIHRGKAYIASDRRISTSDRETGAYISGHDEVKLHGLGSTYYTVLGIEPLRTWVRDHIELQGSFNISQVIEVCREQEILFKRLFSNAQHQADFTQGGTALLTIIWANDNPEIGMTSSDQDYELNICNHDGRVLSRSAINSKIMLPIILEHFDAGHPSMVHVLGHIFKDSSQVSRAVSKKFDYAIISKKENKNQIGELATKETSVPRAVSSARIISDSTIDVTTDLSVGSKICMQAQNYDGGIYFNTFNSNAKINVDPGGALLFGTPIYTPSIHPWNGVSGTFKDKNDKTIEVKDGIITNIG